MLKTVSTDRQLYSLGQYQRRATALLETFDMKTNVLRARNIIRGMSENGVYTMNSVPKWLGTVVIDVW